MRQITKVKDAMKRLVCALLFASTLLIGQNGQGQNGQGQNGQGQNGQGKNGVSMPEPSAIPELILCLGAIGFWTWRQRKAV